MDAIARFLAARLPALPRLFFGAPPPAPPPPPQPAPAPRRSSVAALPRPPCGLHSPRPTLAGWKRPAARRDDAHADAARQEVDATPPTPLRPTPHAVDDDDDDDPAAACGTPTSAHWDDAALDVTAASAGEPSPLSPPSPPEHDVIGSRYWLRPCAAATAALTAAAAFSCTTRASLEAATRGLPVLKAATWGDVEATYQWLARTASRAGGGGSAVQRLRDAPPGLLLGAVMHLAFTLAPQQCGRMVHEFLPATHRDTDGTVPSTDAATWLRTQGMLWQLRYAVPPPAPRSSPMPATDDALPALPPPPPPAPAAFSSLAPPSTRLRDAGHLVDVTAACVAAELLRQQRDDATIVAATGGSDVDDADDDGDDGDDDGDNDDGVQAPPAAKRACVEAAAAAAPATTLSHPPSAAAAAAAAATAAAAAVDTDPAAAAGGASQESMASTSSSPGGGDSSAASAAAITSFARRFMGDVACKRRRHRRHRRRQARGGGGGAPPPTVSFVPPPWQLPRTAGGAAFAASSDPLSAFMLAADYY